MTSTIPTSKPDVQIPPLDFETRETLVTACTTPLRKRKCKGKRCVICLEAFKGTFDDDSYLVVTHCHHVAHKFCLVDRAYSDTKCPLCRAQIFASPAQKGFTRNTMRKFKIPFEGGEYVVSAVLFLEWAASVGSEPADFVQMEGFRGFWDVEHALEDHLLGFQGKRVARAVGDCDWQTAAEWLGVSVDAAFD
ncbi:hypothetical protein P153DRAFT_386959 [Dothidotthia symphoricarpi CBS 119687]|uniref:RING-type domain-containing protein n=1 Tax=Dothidotthia symphoricarpi CBS 119687 TaxID=1392245 RepID=A0A6A6A9W1_9PLEO|nr:uncharacterized protein P153DRAFT_386959 [Dothidotthia symphoricarpi CBS 119687]KAF2127983.1 hypothetical protein P153DRAFT_386959 [Dothidotthia symphoricarpi CBS 119687]